MPTAVPEHTPEPNPILGPTNSAPGQADVPPMCIPCGVIDAAFVADLRKCTADVFWKEDPQGLEECSDHDRDHGLHPPHVPDVVVYPKVTSEVQLIVRLCAQHHVNMVPRGAGTGLEGGCVAYHGGVVINTSRMKALEVKPDDFLVVCGPGWLKNELNAKLAEHKLLFGPDPSSNPCVGGMCSTGGSGLSTLKYGTTRENVVSLRVVMPDGEEILTRQKVRKSSAGYDLTPLFAGAEGTLGIITELTLRVFPLLPLKCGAVAAFENVATACRTVVALRSAAINSLVRCEMVNIEMLAATNKKFGAVLPEKVTVFLELQGTEWDILRKDADHCEKLVCQDSISYRYAENDALDDLWNARRGCYWASKALKPAPGQQIYISDICVPMPRLADMVSMTEADFKAAGFPCLMCCHIADGNFHCLIPYQPEELAAMQALERKMIKRTIEYGGTVSGEHGVGVGKAEYLLEQHGPAYVNLMQKIKRTLDPHNLMNPGKIFTLPPGAGNLQGKL